MPHDESQPVPTFRPDIPSSTEPPETDRGSDSLPTPQPLLRLPDDTRPIPPGFELGDELGRGGMGVVYAARDLEVGREVAVKLLRPEYVGHESSAKRFVEEAQITGQLQHPGIPAVYRVGTLPDGSPFLAMKLVKGRTLAELLKDMPDRGRLIGVFEGICQAVGYAHAHGVIHRDLKPQNVMVGAFGEVQVMDWGLAKQTRNAELGLRIAETDPDFRSAIRVPRSELTQAGSVMGTPAYMPPEQAVGDIARVDARSDVFGLGGILCALLTGKPPYVSDSAESTHQLAAQAKLTDAYGRLDEADADPDLVSLCKRCLSADPNARPADGAEVGRIVADLRAAADERARQAEVESERAAVRMIEERKRRRVWYWVAAASGVGVVASIAFGLWAMSEAKAARTAEGIAHGEAVKAQAAEADAVTQKNTAVEKEQAATAAKEFMQSVLVQASADGQASRERIADPNLPLWKSLDYAAERIEKHFAGQPLIEADLRGTIGTAYDHLGRFEPAERHLRRALALRETNLGPEHRDTLRSLNDVGTMLVAKGDATAESLFRRALAGAEKIHGPDHPETLTYVSNLATCLIERGNLAEAEPLHHRALAGREKALGPDHPDTLLSVHNMAGLLRAKRDLAAAGPLFRRALSGFEVVFGPDHPKTLVCAENLAMIVQAKGDLVAAEALYRRVLAGLERTHNTDHPATLRALNNLAILLTAKRDHAAVVEIFRKIIPAYEKLHGPDDLRTLTAVNNFAFALGQAGDHAAAEAQYSRVLAGFEKWLGPDHEHTLIAVGSLGRLYALTHRGELAVKMYDRYISGQRKLATPSLLASRLWDAAGSLLDAGQFAVAERHIRESLTIREALQPTTWSTHFARSMLGEALLGQKKYADAEPLLVAGYDGLRRQEKTIPPQSRNSLFLAGSRLIDLYTATGRAEKAAAIRAALPKELAPPPRAGR